MITAIIGSSIVLIILIIVVAIIFKQLSTIKHDYNSKLKTVVNQVNESILYEQEYDKQLKSEIDDINQKDIWNVKMNKDKSVDIINTVNSETIIANKLNLTGNATTTGSIDAGNLTVSGQGVATQPWVNATSKPQWKNIQGAPNIKTSGDDVNIATNVLNANGSAAHPGSVVVGKNQTTQDMWGFNYGIHSLNPHLNQWSHFPWADGKNYIRGNLRVDGVVDMPKGIQVTNSDPGPMIEKVYGGNPGDRYGVGQFDPGVGNMRLYTARTHGPATASLSIAEKNGGFTDVMTVDHKDGEQATVNGRFVVKRGNGDWNWMRIQGNHGDNAYMGSDGTNRGIWADGARDFTIFNQGNPGLTVKQDGSVKATKSFCIGNTCITELDLQGLLQAKSTESALLANSEMTKPMRDGLAFRIFYGYFNDDISHFKRAEIGYGQGIAPNVSDISSGTHNIVQIDGPIHDHSIEWTGLFKARVSGVHTFWISSDDASYVWIGQYASTGYTTGNAIINNGGGHGMVERSATINMVKDEFYPIRIQYGEGGGGHNCAFSFQQPGGQRNYVGNGYYFNNFTWRKGRYIKLQGNRQDCMNIAEVRVFDHAGNNVSQGKPVSHSSGYQGDMFPASILVNGNTNDFAHSSCGDVPWMIIDLQALTEITQISVYNRADCCQSRTAGTVVQILDTDKTTVLFTSKPLTADMLQNIFPS